MSKRGAIRRWKTKRANAKRLRAQLKRLRRLLPKKGKCRVVFNKRAGAVVIDMPRTISLSNPILHAQLTRAMQVLRRAFSTPTVGVRVDFSAVELMFPEGMLLFYAELTRLLAAFPHKRLSCVPSVAPKCHQVLQHLGIYSMLGHHISLVPTLSDAVNWRVARAVVVDGKKAGNLIEEMGRLSDANISTLYKSVSEAITNVSNHSDIAVRQDGLNLPATKEWWMFCRQEERYLFVVVCDLGIGIPRSLPKRHTIEVIHAAMSKMFGDRRPTDGRMIKAALRLRRTRTGHQNRGMGFSDIISVIHKVEGSALRVYSNRGSLLYKALGSKSSTRVRTFKNSILGTILVWRFPLGEDHHVK